VPARPGMRNASVFLDQMLLPQHADFFSRLLHDACKARRRAPSSSPRTTLKLGHLVVGIQRWQRSNSDRPAPAKNCVSKPVVRFANRRFGTRQTVSASSLSYQAIAVPIGLPHNRGAKKHRMASSVSGTWRGVMGSLSKKTPKKDARHLTRPRPSAPTPGSCHRLRRP